MEREGDEGFPGAGGGVEDDVFSREELEDGLFLVVVGCDVFRGEVVEEGIEDTVVRSGVSGEFFQERHGRLRVGDIREESRK